MYRATTFYILIIKLNSIWIEWKIIETEFNSINFCILIDWKSIIFVWTVIIISASIIIYSKFYIPNKEKTKFIKLILTFVVSIVLLIISPNIISIIIGWEILGISSFILILYFINKISLIRRIYTIIINRVGDIILIIRVILAINTNSWALTSAINNHIRYPLIIIIISLFSKRAQIPFSSWLTEAIAAPTPVSALVHSSTLVTAGVYIAIRLEVRIKITNINKIIFSVSIITLLIASLNASIELDIKKLIALSTLSQISIIFLAISINIYKIALFHILIHASFKALIFICSRTLISIRNRQDLRKITTTNKTRIITTLIINVASITLCGLIFRSAFYSKELIIEIIIIKITNYACIIMFIACISITIFYSLKIILIINVKKNQTPIKIRSENTNQITSKFIIFVPSVISGNKINWIINLNSNIPYINIQEKIIPIVVIFLTALIIEKAINKKITNKNTNKKIILNLMWFIKNLRINYKKTLFTRIFYLKKITEKGILLNITNKIKTETIKIQAAKTLFTQRRFKKLTLTIFIVNLIIICQDSLKSKAKYWKYLNTSQF